MEATKVGEDSSIQRMIRLVQSADAGKAKIVRLADRWAVWIVAGAASIAVLSYIFTHDIIRSVTVLVVFCPCALVLATPTAVMAGIGNVTKHGFLVREGDALEKLSTVTNITFDKTGTLTHGTPEVTAVVPAGSLSPAKLLGITAAVEKTQSILWARRLSWVQRKGTSLRQRLPVSACSQARGSAGLLKIILCSQGTGNFSPETI